VVKKTPMKKIFSIILLIFLSSQLAAQEIDMEKVFTNPPQSAKPWVFWYWMHGAISKAGITADLEAMQQVGIGGAYLMPIKDTVATVPFQPTVRQLTPEWWAMVKFAMQEAKRLKLQLAMHVSDGFALAGGPWITPELSMQKMVFTKTYIAAGEKIQLPKPEAYQGFFKDIAVFAYPNNFKSDNKLTGITTSAAPANANFLADLKSNETFRSDTACWIKFTYDKPFTLRQIKIKKQNNSYQSQRFVVQASDDGIDFISIDTLIPPRHGWQDWDEDYTHAVNTHTAKYFRLLWSAAGTEPGSEDLEAAKWGTALKVKGIYLSSEPVINNYEAKNGSIWRVANATTTNEVPDSNAVPLKSIIDVSSKMDTAGNLNWIAPAGDWVIVRIGHTSTGATNATAGAGKGLECDKFNAAAITLQFDNWFAKAFSNTDPALAKEVLKVFHVDSWECGSQNWSSTFEKEFLKRRGYELKPYLLTMAGIPINDAATSEKILHDVRQTIADLVNDVFYTTLKNLAHQKGCSFSAEAIAPTMVSDGLLHYKNVDLPMGEFWLNSPTHDKPNDMLDAISGAHIYGKNIVQAEAFTSVRMNWGEHPGNLKILGDRNFALGINKLVLHVFTHNPWMNKKPGMTLDGVGLYFQRDQTWFKQSKAWIDYITRCQALLQLGKPVVDIAVFTGEEIPRRAVLPDRLVNTLPGIFGKEKVAAEKIRLQNAGQPTRKIPDGVTHSANMADPEDWVGPLNGYAYDSFNPDALMMMQVKNGKVVLPGGASYAVLVLPAQQKLNKNNTVISLTVAKKILQLVNNGAKVIMDKNYLSGIGLKDNDDSVKQIVQLLLNNKSKKGKIIFTPYSEASFEKLGIEKDVEILNNDHSIAWTHRKIGNDELYFISNQKNSEQIIDLSFRIAGLMPEEWDPVDTTEMGQSLGWKVKNKRTFTTVRLAANQSVFLVFRTPALKYQRGILSARTSYTGKLSRNKWSIQFDEKMGGPATPIIVDTFKSWTTEKDTAIKYYSGTAVYSNTFNIDEKRKSAYITFDTICNIATIKINGIDCGTLFTAPYQLNITKAIKPGINKIEIAVTNTWHNRLIGDNLLPVEKRITFTTAPFRLKDKPLLPAGLIGEVKIVVW
jgi:hypothetical protein